MNTPDSRLPPGATPAGYAWLKQHFDLKVLPHFRESYIVQRGTRKTTESGGTEIEIYTKTYAPDPTPVGHMEFALKREGLNLEIFKAAFSKVSDQELAEHILKKPTGRYSKKLWFLFEFLTKQRLEIPDLDRSNYVDLLDEKQYYTADRVQIRRQRVNDNLLGGPDFCPIVRRTVGLKEWEEKALDSRIRQILERYPQDVVKRALNQSYFAETRSSFEIENQPSKGEAAERFVLLLQEAGTRSFFDKSALMELQGAIIGGDPRFAARDYRDSQVYVSSVTVGGDQTMHLIPPKPADLPNLMDGMFLCFDRIMSSDVHAVISAAIIAYGFVYMHPFLDGNGRIHRFLIHHVLSGKGFTPNGLCFPVSATMYKQMNKYQESLNLFSQPLLSVTERSVDGDGVMAVTNKTADYFRYIDFTKIAEPLFTFIEDAADREFIEGLEFLESFDEARKSIRDVVDGLGKKEDLLILLCRKNNGKLSPKKRQKHFPMLTDAEVLEIEGVVKEAFALTGEERGS